MPFVSLRTLSRDLLPPHLEVEEVLERAYLAGGHELHGEHPLVRLVLVVGSQAHAPIGDHELDDQVPVCVCHRDQVVVVSVHRCIMMWSHGRDDGGVLGSVLARDLDLAHLLQRYQAARLGFLRSSHPTQPRKSHQRSWPIGYAGGSERQARTLALR